MAMWHCPHCGAPQPEASRCWVCHRSSTTCSTCRHFRRAVAGQVGFCGLDRRRAPLRGDEIRGCWAVGAEHVEEPESPPDADLVRPVHRLRDFVPIDELGRQDPGPHDGAPKRASRPRPAASAGAPVPSVVRIQPIPPVPSVALDADSWRDRVSLFGDEA